MKANKKNKAAWGLIAIVLGLSFGLAAEDPLVGVWQGTTQTKIGPVEFYFTIEAAGGGGYAARVSIPAQKVREMAIQGVRYAAPAVVLDMSSYGVTFEGKIAGDGAAIEGRIKLGPDDLPLILRRAAAVPESRRPQEPVKPYPYEEREVRILNREAGIHLAGTLTLPLGDGPFPGVVLISGSGPQDRDSGLAGHRPFLIWADALTRRGLAVLRCDDRGVWRSEGNFRTATTVDFASDARAAWDFLRSQAKVDSRKVGFIGHSEGALIGSMVAAKIPDVAFLVLLAGTGIPGDRLAVLQAETVSRVRGVGPEAVQKEAGMNARLYQVIKDRETFSDAEADLKRIIAESLAGMSEAERKELKASEASVLEDLRGMAVDYPWARFFMGYDPAADLRKIRCPVLALSGEKDTQVPADINLAAIASALKEGGNGRVETHKLQGLNHLFQTAPSGDPREYRVLDETVAPGVLKIVGDWILKNE